jgi:flagellar protein FlbT
MYLSKDPQAQGIYDRLVPEMLQAVPSMRPYIEIINDHIAAGEFYKALKATKNLIAHEEQLVKRAEAVRRAS